MGNSQSYSNTNVSQAFDFTQIPKSEEMNNLQLGWKKDKPDSRDLKFTFINTDHVKDIQSVDLRGKMPNVLNQGHLGSCTSFATGYAFTYDEINNHTNGKSKNYFQVGKKNTPNDLIPSHLFEYYNARSIEGTTGEDSGASIRDAVKAVNKFGMCQESSWPYDISKFTEKPPEECYTIAVNHKSILYRRLDQDINQLKACLVKEYPFVCGVAVYDSFMSEKANQTGMIPIPKPTEKKLGGHALCFCGYDDDMKCFIFQNSWNSSWGDNGYGYLPYEYMLCPELASDFWVITKIQESLSN